MNGIVVREFDNINEQMFIEAITNYNNEFNELIQFVEEFAASKENADAYNFISIKRNRKWGEFVTFKNYVGLIQLKSGFQIEILPKIDMAPTIKDTKKTFLKMLRSMKDFNGKTFNISNLDVDKMNLYEVFINLYIQEVDRLVKRGLKSAYVQQEDNLTVAKGKLMINEQIKKNFIHKEKFYCSYDEYQQNRPENKLIKSTLLKLNGITENSNNKKFCRQLLSHFEMVDPSVNYDFDFSKIVLDRNTKDYETLMNWSKVFLKNKSFTTFTGDSKSRASLFQMDKLFESYVGKYVKQVFQDTVYSVSTQDSGYHLFNDPEQKFKLRPDIVLKKDDGTVVIMDTKWKALKDESSNYGISQSDMYQMYAYSKKYGENRYNPEVWVLYPLNSQMKKNQDISFVDNDAGANGVKVHIAFVDVFNIVSSLEEIKKAICD